MMGIKYINGMQRKIIHITDSVNEGIIKESKKLGLTHEKYIELACRRFIGMDEEERNHIIQELAYYRNKEQMQEYIIDKFRGIRWAMKRIEKSFKNGEWE